MAKNAKFNRAFDGCMTLSTCEQGLNIEENRTETNLGLKNGKVPKSVSDQRPKVKSVKNQKWEQK